MQKYFPKTSPTGAVTHTIYNPFSGSYKSCINLVIKSYNQYMVHDAFVFNKCDTCDLQCGTTCVQSIVSFAGIVPFFWIFFRSLFA